MNILIHTNENDVLEEIFVEDEREIKVAIISQTPDGKALEPELFATTENGVYVDETFQKIRDQKSQEVLREAAVIFNKYSPQELVLFSEELERIITNGNK